MWLYFFQCPEVLWPVVTDKLSGNAMSCKADLRVEMILVELFGQLDYFGQSREAIIMIAIPIECELTDPTFCLGNFGMIEGVKGLYFLFHIYC